MKATLIIALFISVFFYETNGQEKTIVVTSTRNDDKSVSLMYTKQAIGKFYLSVWFTQLENTSSGGYNNEVSGGAGNIMHLRPRNTDQHINYSYSYWYIRGKLKPAYDPEFPYLLPISTKKFSSINYMTNLNEKYFGAESPKNWASYLFHAEVGDTVYAARKGIIVEIKDEQDYQTSFSVTYQSSANKIIVEHPDGTLSSYTGFHKNNIFLKEGDKIYPRTPLGTLAQYDDREKAQLRFSVYYLDKVTPGQEKPKALKDQIQYYSYIKPKFVTENGLIQLENTQKYKAVIDQKIVEKEMSKREKKKIANPK